MRCARPLRSGGRAPAAALGLRLHRRARLKIHSDIRYGNLYHWLLGDESFVRCQGGYPLRSNRFTAYRESAEVA